MIYGDDCGRLCIGEKMVCNKPITNSKNQTVLNNNDEFEEYLNEHIQSNDIPIINAMRQYIINLVKTGNPNGPNLPQWPKVKNTNTAWMQFDEEPVVGYKLWHRKLDMLQRAYESRILPLVQQ